MATAEITLRIRQKTALDREIEAFLIDRQARGLSPRTIDYYAEKLGLLSRFLTEQGISTVEAISAPLLRRYLLQLSRTHKPGGVHAIYRALKAFLRWYEAEVEPEDWKNPMARVKAPKVVQEPLDPLPIEHLRKMLGTCQSKTLADQRDKAILLTLLDTGLRASECLGLNLGDVELGSGSVLVRRGKGGKVRTVFLGAKSRRALVAYLRARSSSADSEPLFTGRTRERLTYWGLRDVVRRRANQAGVPGPSLHAFRRAFALLSLRGGMDIFSLQRLMGHSDLSVLRRYLAQTEDDLRLAHRRVGLADKLV
ncbi:MAG: tyrosine-type recombinase/integrase [Anaerolineae bacterium]